MQNEHFSESLKRVRSAVKSGKKVYGIFGSPISHSLSPLMHSEAFKLNNLDAVYIPFYVEKSDLEKSLRTVLNCGVEGLNITLPLKESIVHYLDKVSPEADTIGSVNTVQYSQGKTTGYNTDLEGFLTPLRDHIEGVRYDGVTIFGSGGSARTVLYALLSTYSFPQITLISRNKEKGNGLLDIAEEWKQESATVLEWANFDDLSHYSERIWESKLLINCTPLGMKGNVNEFPDDFARFFHPGQVAYDLIYTPLHTSFLKKAGNHGTLIQSGLDMFINQGALSFHIWTGTDMPIAPIREYLFYHLSKNND